MEKRIFELERSVSILQQQNVNLEQKVSTMSEIIKGLSSNAQLDLENINRILRSSVFIKIYGTNSLNEPSLISTGSGFIIDPNGFIVTNQHVVGNHSMCTVELYVGSEFEGQAVGTDEGKDFAVVKIEAEGLPVVNLDTSEHVNLSDQVLMIGNPLGYKNTLARGFVSSKKRSGKDMNFHDEVKRGMKYIQFDATTNFGFSGAALINNKGNVIGINTYKQGQLGGFAIPVEYLNEFLNKFKNAWLGGCLPYVVPSIISCLGIYVISLSPNIAIKLQHQNPDFPGISKGVYVQDIQSGSPADLCGMRVGDVITLINQTCIQSRSDMVKALCFNSGLHITVQRRSEMIVLNVVAEWQSG